MVDKRCFVQFPHPGGEHKPDGDRKIGWNKTYRNNKLNPHKRKFMQFQGKWADENGNEHPAKLRAWGEWEPESKIICKFDREDGRPHHPRYLWKPYWVRKDNYRCLHNTDPFIFGDSFLYSNCGQPAESKKALKHLDVGSVIAFGSGKKIDGKWKWMLDTVFVVRGSCCYDPLNPRQMLEGKVPDEFLEVTAGPQVASTKDLREGSASAACAPKSEQLRLYWGATPDNPVDEMFSFFPAVPADRESSFARPVIDLKDAKVLNPSNLQSPKGAGRCRKPEELRRVWKSLVEQVHKRDLVLGSHAEMPPEYRAV